MKAPASGFTLIEISIVLVIIGLIVGGVLLGTDLIRGAQIRGTLSQVEKYATATHTFRIKYRSLPGDISAANAASFGFLARAGGTGDGDANGKVESLPGISMGLNGEVVFFWTDLSSAQMVDGSYTQNGDGTITLNCTIMCAGPFTPYFPQGKAGVGTSIIAFENLAPPWGIPRYTGLVFEIAKVAGALPDGTGFLAQASLTPTQAFEIDNKRDDGMPQNGKILVAYPARSGLSSTMGTTNVTVPQTGATSDYCVSNAATTPYNLVFPNDVTCLLVMASP